MFQTKIIIIPALYFAGLVLCITPLHVSASIIQPIELSSSLNPVGSGARALGMGGAFIGVADDATAASWNPGGLIQVRKPEISIIGAFNKRTQDTTYDSFVEESGQISEDYELNYLSATYPFVLFNRNMVASLSYQHLYDFQEKGRFSFTYKSNDELLTLEENGDYKKQGALRTISPALAVEITPVLSLGITFNFWENAIYDNKWKTRYQYDGIGKLGENHIRVHSDSFDQYGMDGFNFNIGLLWNINPTFTLGGVIKTPFEAKLIYDSRYVESLTCPSAPENNEYTKSILSEKATLDMPLSYGIGLAVRLNDALTFDVDIYRTKWGDYVLHRANGEKVSPVSNISEKESKIKSTTQIRIGGEYLIIGESLAFPIRAGIFYDPEPAEGSPDDFFGFSIGSGFSYKRFVYDIAYQYRFGRDVRTAIVGDANSSRDVDQHTLYMSIIYHF
ncbi:MAG: hypothetical protein GY864_13630 [Desulfobacterales bacterium]|nr:hypothetical protein [Desulfobacterales bacterium]